MGHIFDHVLITWILAACQVPRNSPLVPSHVNRRCEIRSLLNARYCSVSDCLGFPVIDVLRLDDAELSFLIRRRDDLLWFYIAIV